jgi:hypothetical protein
MSIISFQNVEIYELILYIFYIYCLIFLAIIFEPNKYTVTLLFLYVYYIAWNIINPDNCINITFFLRFLSISIYTFGCVVLYKIINFIYWKKNNYKFVFLLLPFCYFFIVKLWFYIFDCDKYSNLNYFISVFNSVI